MQILHTQQGYGSRDARSPIMLAGPCAYGDGLLGINACTANGPPSSRSHAKVFMAMASEGLHQSETQSKKCEENFVQCWRKNDNAVKQKPRPNPSQHTQRRNDHRLPYNPSSPQVSQGLGLGLDREIQKFCHLGQLDTALPLLLHAEERGDFPSESSYRSLFKACSKLHDVKKLQAHLARCNLELSHPLGELLVVALLKCGGIEDALQVFHALPQHTVFSWSAVISHYADCSNGLEALRLYGYMQEEGVEPNEYTYVALFKACGSIPDLKMGTTLHADARTKGFNSSPFVANTLVSMYGKCGRIVEAENVFFGMLERNLVSWNAMISAYVECNETENALQLYKEMQEEGVNPNNRTFVFTLQACCLLADKEGAVSVNNKLTKVSALELAHRLHVDVQIKGLDSDIFVGNALVKVYGKCGSVGEAQGVFYGLPQRNLVSWNTLFSVFVEHGRGEKALRLFRQMQEEGVTPDERTFVNAVQACCIYSGKEEAFAIDTQWQKFISLDVGQGLHADARRMGFASNVFLGNTLITLYGKCGSLLEAENVLSGLSQRNIVSWTAMLSGYIEQSKAKEALLLYTGIHKEGMNPDERTLAITLQACGILSDSEEATLQEGKAIKGISLQIGQALHFDGKRMGTCSDPFVVSSLINLYGKCGCVVEAETIFCESFQSGVVSWNVMLSTYNEQGEAMKALELYRQMQEEGVKPDERTFVIVLQSCCALAEFEAAVAMKNESALAILLDIGQSLHADVWKRGLGSDPYISSALVSLYGKCGSIKEAENVFVAFCKPDIMLWNAMLLAYVGQGEAEKTLQLFGQMYREGVSPDKGTCVITLQAVCVIAEKEKASRLKGRFIKAMSLRIGENLHAIARARGFDSDVFVGTTLLSMYGKCRCIAEAEAVFIELPFRNIVSWNTMLSAYIEQGLGEQGLVLYKRMQEEGVILDDITLTCLLQACSLLESKELCRHIHFTIVSAGCDTSLPLATTLIHAYGNCALTADAQAIFNKLPLPDAVSWSALIAGYARERNTFASLATFEKMQDANVQPTGLTFLSLLFACSHAGLVDKGLAYFKSMSRDYDITPELEHYVTLIDLLCRAGEFQRLKDILLNVPMQPDPAFWLGLLSACQKHGNAEVEKLVVAQAVHLQSSHPKAYKLLMSMCAGEPKVHSCSIDGIIDGQQEEDD
eukprot:c22412_g1_i1 orf=86-3610(+)